MLNLTQDIKPISYVKTHTAEIIRLVQEKKNPLVITQNGEASAVLLDIGTYQSLIDAIQLMKIVSIGENDLENGRFITDDELNNRIQKILEQ